VVETNVEQISFHDDGDDNNNKKKIHLTTATCDRELQDHRRLVNDLFQADGMDLEACVNKQLTALDMLGLTFRDAGAINRNERNEIIHNSCFYLSLATSYLWGIGALSFHNNKESTSTINCSNEKGEDEDELLVGDTALQLKQTDDRSSKPWSSLIQNGSYKARLGRKSKLFPTFWCTHSTRTHS